MERTLIIVKPDGVQRGLAGAILARLEGRGLRFVGLKLMRIDRDLAARHYAEHEGKSFHAGLISYISSGPVVVAVLEGPDAAAAVRLSVGATNPAQAAPGTIRGDHSISMSRNLVHASDSPASGQREVALFFREEELLAYRRDIDAWIMDD